MWLYNPQSKRGSPKLQTPWKGPWEVTKQVTDVVYQIQKTPKGKPKFVHHDRLKPCDNSFSVLKKIKGLVVLGN